MTHAPRTSSIDGLFFGKVQDLWPGRDQSAIDKMPVQGRHDIDALGFVGDAQADPKHHGGVDKAIHHYASEHYDRWIAEGEIPTGTIPAAFGENIASLGLTEDTLCIGDKLRLGSAVVQISQGRQPCWKVSEHTANKKMAYLFQKTGRTGWYYRVLEPGSAGIGDTISLLERTQSLALVYLRPECLLQCNAALITQTPPSAV
ncbi:MAG: MOSC domain-containing protein [Albidovulum sp.]